MTLFYTVLPAAAITWPCAFDPEHLPTTAITLCTGNDILLGSTTQSEVYAIALIHRNATMLYQDLFSPTQEINTPTFQLHSRVLPYRGNTLHYQQDIQIPMPMWHLHLSMQMQQTLMPGDTLHHKYQWQNEQIHGDLLHVHSQTTIYAIDTEHSVLMYCINLQTDPHFWVLRLFPKAFQEISHYLPWLTASIYMRMVQQRYPDLFEPYHRLHPDTDPAGWIRLHTDRNYSSVISTWDYPLPQSFSESHLLLLQRYHEFMPALHKVSVSNHSGVQWSHWILTIHLGPIRFYRDYWMQLRHVDHSFLFTGYDEQQHALHGQWDFSTINNHCHNILELRLQPEDQSWIHGLLSYSPFPMYSSTLLASLMLMQRSNTWLIKQKIFSAPDSAIHPATKHTESGP